MTIDRDSQTDALIIATAKGNVPLQVVRGSGARQAVTSSASSKVIPLPAGLEGMELSAVENVYINFGIDDTVVATSTIVSDGSRLFLAGVQVVPVPLDPATGIPYTFMAVIRKSIDGIFQVESGSVNVPFPALPAPPIPSAGPDLDTLSLTDTFSLSVDAQDPQDVWISPDGKNIFAVSDDPDKVMVHYTMSVAFDLTTISAKQSERVTSARTFGIAGNPDGTKVYAGEFGTGNIVEYTMSTAYDLTTAVQTHVYDYATDSGENAFALHFNFDGTELLIGNNGSTVDRISLSTPYDLSTETYPNDTFDATAQITVSFGVAWDTDGLKMYISDVTSDKIYQYTLSAPFDVSTAVYASKSLNPSVLNNAGLHLDTENGVLYVVHDATDTPQIAEYK